MIDALTPDQIAQFEAACAASSRTDFAELSPQQLTQTTDPTVAALLGLAAAEPATIRQLEAGTQIDGYILRERLGGGGFGEVWRGRRFDGGEDVAIKLIRREHLKGLQADRWVRLFREEIARHERMLHPGIVRVLNTGAAVLPGFPEPVPYLVMELWPGRPLIDACRGHSLGAKLRCFREICQAVQHAHRQGIMHLDLKPENILVVEHHGRLRPKVLDFGLARAFRADRPLQPGRFGAGTLPYQAPEQIDPELGGEDFRTDVHALGVLLFQLLTDRLPYELPTGTRAELKEQIRRGRRLPLTDYEVRAGAHLESICSRAVARERARRFDSPAQLAAAITPLLPGFALRIFHIRRAGFVLLLLVGFAAGLVIWRKPPPRLPAESAVLRDLGQSYGKGNRIIIDRVPIDCPAADPNWTWDDICWDGSLGLLAGESEATGGTNGFVGYGILLLTHDHGKTWTNVSPNFEFDRGNIPKFENQFWKGVGTMRQIRVQPKNTPNGRVTNGTAVSVTGIYTSTNPWSPTSAWRRVSPAPTANTLACFAGGEDLEGGREWFFFGWSGIVHWDGRSGWEQRLLSMKYSIEGMAITDHVHGDYWAVGAGGLDKMGQSDGFFRHAAIYHHSAMDHIWRRLTFSDDDRLIGGSGFHAILRLGDALFAVGGNNTILRGILNETNAVWDRLSLPGEGSLGSLANDDKHQIWVVGEGGTLLSSANRGATWLQHECVDERGQMCRENFTRIRIFGQVAWLIANNKVYRFELFPP